LQIMGDLICSDLKSGSQSHLCLENTRVTLLSAQTVERTAPWFLPASGGAASFYVVLAGGCRIYLEGEDTPVSLRKGDLAVLLHGKRHWVRNDRIQADKSILYRGRFAWNAPDAAALISCLPDVIQFKGENGILVPWMSLFSWVIADDSTPADIHALKTIHQMAYAIVLQSVLQGRPD
jgi:hypothetical protein